MPTRHVGCPRVRPFVHPWVRPRVHPRVHPRNVRTRSDRSRVRPWIHTWIRPWIRPRVRPRNGRGLDRTEAASSRSFPANSIAAEPLRRTSDTHTKKKRKREKKLWPAASLAMADGGDDFWPTSCRPLEEVPDSHPDAPSSQLGSILMHTDRRPDVPFDIPSNSLCARAWAVDPIEWLDPRRIVGQTSSTVSSIRSMFSPPSGTILPRKKPKGHQRQKKTQRRRTCRPRRASIRTDFSGVSTIKSGAPPRFGCKVNFSSISFFYFVFFLPIILGDPNGDQVSAQLQVQILHPMQ